MTRVSVGWLFDGLPPSGARRGGDPSEYVFRHDIESFVREVVQNANDQALGCRRTIPAIHISAVWHYFAVPEW